MATQATPLSGFGMVGPTLQPGYETFPMHMSSIQRDHVAWSSPLLKKPIVGSIPPPSEAAVRIFPRRKAGDLPSKTFRSRAPLQINRDTIVAWFEWPMPQAAQHLGISITALKQVCRKLGVLRWPYRRRDSKQPRASLIVQPDGPDLASDGPDLVTFQWGGGFIQAASTGDEMTEPQKITVESDDIASITDACENEPATAAQGTFVHWDGWISRPLQGK